MDDFIISRAELFCRRFLCNGSRPNELIQSAKEELHNIYETNEKIKFLQVILENNKGSMEAHIKECTHQHCARIQNHRQIAYFLGQQLKALGFADGDDSFTRSEKSNLNEKIDKILSDLQVVKDGNQVIYEDLSEQLIELKELYYLGKKKWHQIMVGRIFEMTLSGIISNTISKSILQELKDFTDLMLNQ